MVDRALRFDLLGRDKSLGRTLGQAESKLGRFGRVMGRTALVGGAALAGLGAAAGLMGIKTLASLESAEVGFTTLLGSGQKAKRFIADLKGFAKRTPFELPGLIEAARGLLGAGRAAHEVIPALRAYGDAAGALGLNQEQFGRIMRAVNQIMSTGKVQGDELNQMVEAGIPIYPLLAKAMGKSVAEIRAMGKAGKLLSKDVLPALEAQMAQDYGGSMAKQSKTLTGLWSTLMDTINIGLADTLKPFQDEIKTGLTTAVRVLGSAFEKIPKAVDAVFGKGGVFADIDLGDAVKKLKRLSEPFRAAAKGWTLAIVGGIKTGLRTGDWSDLGGILGNVLQRVIGNGADLLKRAFSGVDWVTVGKTVGSGAFGFAVGFVSALGGDFLTVAREHPLDLVLFFTSFLGVGKAAGVLLKIVSKIPILRSVAGPLLRGIQGATAPINAAIGKLVGHIGGGLFEGLARVFPRATGFIKRALGDMVAWFSLRAEGFRKGGSLMVRNLAVGIGEQIGRVAADIGRVIRAITRPFTGSAMWLVRRGVDAILGLVRGVGSMLGRVHTSTQGVRNAIIRPFATAFNWLRSAGSSVVSGFLNGARSMLGRVGDFVVDLKDKIVGGIRRLFNMNSPSKVMFGLGTHMVEGLVRGLMGERGVLKSILSTLGGDVMEFFAGSGGGSASGLVGMAASAFKIFKGIFPGMMIGGWRAKGSVPGSDHPKGKALDLMTSNGAVAAMIISLFQSMLGSKYWIWMRQIASAPDWNPRPYGGPHPHDDHVHASFFRRGGIATRATPGIFGEAGPEALVPLNRAHQFGFGGGGQIAVTLHFHGPVVGGPGAADALADMIVDALKKKKRNSGGLALGIA